MGADGRDISASRKPACCNLTFIFVIHPTAIIDPRAQIPSTAEIGPRVLIEGPVELGENCVIQANAILTGEVKLGSGNKIGYGAILGALPQDLGFKPETPTGVTIGNDNVIREYCTIHRATKPETHTRVGSNNYIMAGAHFAHDVVVQDRCIIANNVLLAGHVHFGNNVVVGGGTVFHQFVRVGSYVMVRGLSAIGKDIPPYTMALAINSVIGLNVVGLRRVGLGAERRGEIKKAFNMLYREGWNTTQALEAAEKIAWGPEAEQFWAFVREAKKRGICRLRRDGAEE